MNFPELKPEPYGHSWIRPSKLRRVCENCKQMIKYDSFNCEWEYCKSVILDGIKCGEVKTDLKGLKSCKEQQDINAMDEALE